MDDVRKFPVFKSVGEVFSGVTRHYFQLLGAAFWGIAAYVVGILLLIYAIGAAAYRTVSSGAVASDSEVSAIFANLLTNVPLAIGAVLLLIVGMLASAVRWHRFVLLGERSGPLFGAFELKYLWVVIKTTFVLICVGLLAGAIIGLIAFVAQSVNVKGELGGALLIFGVVAVYLFLIYVIVRLSVALPDAAMGEGSIRKAWNKTRGNGWRLLGYTIIVQLISIIVMQIVSAVVNLALGTASETADITAILVSIAIQLPLYVYFLMIGVTMLSVAYREIVGLPGEGRATT